jgi:hypothetical protein
VAKNIRVHTRASDRAANAVKNHHQEREDHPVPEFRDFTDVEERGNHCGLNARADTMKFILPVAA